MFFKNISNTLEKELKLDDLLLINLTHIGDFSQLKIKYMNNISSSTNKETIKPTQSNYTSDNPNFPSSQKSVSSQKKYFLLKNPTNFVNNSLISLNKPIKNTISLDLTQVIIVGNLGS